MRSKIIILLIVIALVVFAALPKEGRRANADSNYVKLEVKGLLVQD